MTSQRHSVQSHGQPTFKGSLSGTTNIHRYLVSDNQHAQISCLGQPTVCETFVIVTWRSSVVSSGCSGFLPVKLTFHHHYMYTHRLNMTLAVAEALYSKKPKPSQNPCLGQTISAEFLSQYKCLLLPHPPPPPGRWEDAVNWRRGAGRFPCVFSRSQCRGWGELLIIQVE